MPKLSLTLVGLFSLLISLPLAGQPNRPASSNRSLLGSDLTLPKNASLRELLQFSYTKTQEESYGLALLGLQAIDQTKLTERSDLALYYYVLAVASNGIYDFKTSYKAASQFLSYLPGLNLEPREWSQLIKIYSQNPKLNPDDPGLRLLTKESVSLISQKDTQARQEMLHHLFLIHSSLGNNSLAIDLYLEGEKLNRDFSYGLPEKLLKLPNSAFFDSLLGLANEQSLKEKILLEKIQFQLDSRELSNAESSLREFSQAFPTPIHKKRQLKLQDELKRLSSGGSFKIGVLLPLSTPQLRPLTNQLLQGLRLGLADFLPPSFNWEIVYEDQARPEEVKKQYIKLVEQNKVSLVLGPITKLSTESLADVAEEYGVPVISYSVSASIPAFHPRTAVFQRKPLLEAIIAAQQGMSMLCGKSQVVFYDAANEKLAKTYANIVLSRGVDFLDLRKITSQKDMIDVFNEMTGSSYYQGSSLFIKDATDLKTKEKRQAAQKKEAAPIDLMFMALPNNQAEIVMKFAKLYKFNKTDFVLLSSFADNPLPTNQTNYATDRLFILNTATDKNLNQDLRNRFYLSAYRLNNFDAESSYTLYGYMTPYLIAQALTNNNYLSLGNLSRNLWRPSTESSVVGQVVSFEPSELGIVPNLTHLEDGFFSAL